MTDGYVFSICIFRYVNTAIKGQQQDIIETATVSNMSTEFAETGRESEGCRGREFIY